MATELKLRKGTTAEHSTFTGAEAEVTFDKDKNTVVAHDGTTAGGFPLAKENSIQAGNSSVEVVDSGTGRIEFTVDGSEVARFDDDGRLGVGGSPLFSKIEAYDTAVGDADLIFVANESPTAGSSASINFGPANGVVGGVLSCEATEDFTTPANRTADLTFSVRRNGSLSEAVRIKSNADLKFNSGFGSVATAYGCRAWVNFDGTGVLSIRGSGNVSSVTDNGIGRYTVNFSNSMPDVNYTFSGLISNTENDWSSILTPTSRGACGINQRGTSQPTTSSVQIETLSGGRSNGDGELLDFSSVSFVVFR